MKWLKKVWRYIGILRLCRASGIDLYKWQRRYIWRGPDPRNPMPGGRASGKTLAVCLRALMVSPNDTRALEYIMRCDPDYLAHGRVNIMETLMQYDRWRYHFFKLGYRVAPFDAREHMRNIYWYEKQGSLYRKARKDGKR